MYAKAAFFPCCLLIVVVGAIRPCRADDEAKSEPPAGSAELLVTGTALLADGSRAAGAAIRVYEYSEPARTTTADGFGKFSLKGPCLNGLRLHALSPDERCQAVLFISEDAARSYLSQPLTISLQPAKPHQVAVRADGQPVEGAHVSIAGKLTGYASLQEGVTSANGTATLWLPADEPMLSVVAWHPRHGVGGITYGVHGAIDWNPAAKHAKTEISLLPPGSHVIRLLDSEDRPVAGRTIGASFSPAGGEWTYVKQIGATRATTDENGEVHFDWFPKGVKYVNVELLDRGWKIDKIDNDRTPDGLTAVRVRRAFPVEGRLVLPGEADAQGLLITGSGFGGGTYGDKPLTRTRPDGSFTLHVPSDYGYVLGVYDREWTSDIWSGAVLSLESQTQRDIVLHGERAIPLEVFVTRGPLKEPVENTWLLLSRRGVVEFTDVTGEAQRGFGRVGGWLRTDEKGRARAGVGRGQIEVLMHGDSWSETKSIRVASDELVQVAFHRNWLGNRVLTARLVLDGKKYVLSSDTRALAWSESADAVRAVREPDLTQKGTVTVEFDAEDVSLLVLDHRQRLSGFVTTKGEDHTELDLPMTPSATYSGTLVDERDGAPLADRELCLVTDTGFQNVVDSQRTDRLGRFEFDKVPSGMPLRLSIQDEPGRPEYFLFDAARRFKPGERRIGDTARAELTDPPVAASIAKRTASAAENCRVTGMKALVVLEGDDSKPVKYLAGRLTNEGELHVVDHYLPVAVTAQQQNDDALALAAMQWPRPEAGEVLIVVTADGKEVSATVRLSSTDLEAALRRGTEFIEQHAPPTRDGRKRLDEAKAEAAKSNRTVWVISGGPRCGPCFRLARWIDRHHEILEKDVVILKLTAGLDTDANEIGNEIGGAGEGIPFHAMLSPDGKLLVSSKGPHGNIGMPGSTDRHFRTMLQAARRNLTSAELDNLMDSLKESD